MTTTTTTTTTITCLNPESRCLARDSAYECSHALTSTALRHVDDDDDNGKDNIFAGRWSQKPRRRGRRGTRNGYSNDEGDEDDEDDDDEDDDSRLLRYCFGYSYDEDDEDVDDEYDDGNGNRGPR
jgi:hypothetical protein